MGRQRKPFEGQSEFVLEVLERDETIRSSMERRGLLSPQAAYRSSRDGFEDEAEEEHSYDDSTPEPAHSLEGAGEETEDDALRQGRKDRAEAEDLLASNLSQAALALQLWEERLLAPPTSADELARCFVLGELLVKPPPGLSDD